MPIIWQQSEPDKINFSGLSGMTVNFPVYIAAQFQGESQFSAPLIGSGVSRFEGESQFSAILTVTGPLDDVSFTGESSFSAQLVTRLPDPFRLSINVAIRPTTLGPTSRWLPRVKVDGTEIPVVGGSLDEAVDSAGKILDVRLANLAHRDLFANDSMVDFSFGRKIAGAWDEDTMIDLIELGSVEGRTSQVAQAFDDQRSIRASSPGTFRFRKTPERPLVIYNSSRQTLNITDFETLVDTAGNEYPTELKAIPAMKTSEMIDEVFLKRLLFEFVQTNLPDWELGGLVNCPIGKSFLSSIRGYFGIFSPVIFEWNSGAWIIDTTLALPSGFPQPRLIEADRYRSLSDEEEFSNIDGYLVTYVEHGRDWDFVTEREEVKEINAGESGEDSYTDTLRERTYRQYRTFAQPAVVLREEIAEEETRVSPWTGPDISRSTLSKQYDSRGRHYKTTTSKSGRVPDVENPGTVDIRVLEEIEDTWEYSPHPFIRGKEFVSRHERVTRGLIVVDSNRQQLGEDVRFPYAVANDSANLEEGQTTEFGDIRVQWETYFPLRGNTVRVGEFDQYVLTNNIVKDGAEEDRPGDVALSGNSPQTKQIIVLADDASVRSDRELEEISVGELPPKFFIPMFRRKLASGARGHTFSVDVIGFEEDLRKGMPVYLTGRTPAGGTKEDIGAALILGRRILFGRDGVTMQLTCRKLTEAGPYLFGEGNPQGSFTFSMGSEGVATMTAYIECRTGWELRADPVDDLVVRAWRTDDGGPGTAIESGTIDLSPWNNSVQQFTFELTAAETEVLLNRIVNIYVEY